MGKTREQSTKIDPALQAKALSALTRAEDASRIPFSPNRGVRVAAFNPNQNAAFDGRNAAAAAAGLPQGGAPQMPPLRSGGGIPGYGTGGLYDRALQQSVPQGVQDYISNMFIDPNTGQMPQAPQQQQPQQQPQQQGFGQLPWPTYEQRY